MESGPLEEQQIAFIVAEVVKGLDYLHSQGVRHGEVESRQVMLTPSGEVKLAGLQFATDMLGATQLPRATTCTDNDYKASNSLAPLCVYTLSTFKSTGRHSVTRYDGN